MKKKKKLLRNKKMNLLNNIFDFAFEAFAEADLGLGKSNIVKN